jgi:hypothetical protein
VKFAFGRFTDLISATLNVVSSVRIMAILWAKLPREWTSVVSRSTVYVYFRPPAQAASCLMGIGSFSQRAKRPRRVSDYHLVPKLRMHAVVPLLSHPSSLRGAELIAETT